MTENNSKRTLPTTHRSRQTNKKAKTQEALVPIVFVQLKLKVDPNNPSSHSTEAIKVLLASATLLKESGFERLKLSTKQKRKLYL
jgi:hypothetical protein